MENIVAAGIEIDGNKIEYYTSVTLRQAFNEHHEFTIRINHDVLETFGSFSMMNAQKKMGKPVIIRLQQMANSEGEPYEFRGIICGVKMEQSGKFHGDLVITGYSPTILLENGKHLNSFYDQNLQKITESVSKPLADAGFDLNIKTNFKDKIHYISQYKESSFHFLNRLSSDFSEWFFYDGKVLNFGKPSAMPEVELTYGHDIHSMQLALRILPMSFKNYAYISKEDKVESSDAPKQVEGLGQYASFALKESDNIFSVPVNYPVKQRVDNVSALKKFVKNQKAAMAANLEVLTATSDNPAVAIGSVVSIKILNVGAKEEDYDKFLVTSIDHYITENGKYYNSFEAVPATVEVIPVNNIVLPIAETQIATVTDNKDPDNMGRVRVQMLWQKDINQQTDWVRVMTPDAGSGKGGGKNRGFLVIPEVGDQVVICFRYNDPDRPFVMGSMFHGKTGGGGGESNNTKSLNSKSGHTISLDDGAGITIVDKSGANLVVIDGTDTITVTAKLKIELTNGKSSITMDGDTITISAKHVDIGGSADAKMHSDGDASVTAKKTVVTGSSEVTVTGTKATVNGDAEATLNGGGKTTVSAGGKVAVQGAIVALN
jgi:type VI secretion system secreted protein VgrG